MSKFILRGEQQKSEKGKDAGEMKKRKKEKRKKSRCRSRALSTSIENHPCAVNLLCDELAPSPL